MMISPTSRQQLLLQARGSTCIKEFNTCIKQWEGPRIHYYNFCCCPYPMLRFGYTLTLAICVALEAHPVVGY
eukprot:m.350203 g.350203  ORF g.350203 m.350203 type:complete len:72 (+) comp20692_c0_seq24:1702-1917(+)